MAWAVGVCAEAALAAVAGGGGGGADCPGDLDGDGMTSAADAALLVAAYGVDAEGDLDGDGITDQADLGILVADFGCPAQITFNGTAVVTMAAVNNMLPADDTVHPEFAGGVTHFTFDLRVQVTGTEAWTTGDVSAVIADPKYTFFQHAFLPSDVPLPALWGPFPAMRYDTFWAAPSTPLALVGGMVFETTVGPHEATAVWYEVPVVQASGTIARFTIIGPPGVTPEVRSAASRGASGKVIASITGHITRASTKETLVPVSFEICLPDEVCVGDANGDDATDSADLSVLIGNFGMAVPPGTAGDLNGDGVVDSADLSVVIGDFGCGGG